MSLPLQPAHSASRYVEGGGLRLHYLDYGTARRPAMLCLHGGAAHAHWYDFAASSFTGEHHVIALDQRGHGDSAWSDPPDYTYERFAADVDEVAEKLDLRGFTLVGHSVGGVVALLYAAKHPGRVGKLVIVDSTFTASPERVARFGKLARQPAPSFASRGELIAHYKLNPPETLASSEVVSYLASHDARQGADGLWRRKFDRRFYAQREWVHAFGCWNEIKIPVLLIKAALSERITPEVAVQVQKRCPQTQLKTVGNSHHHVMLDNLAEFVSEVRQFVSTPQA